MNIETKKKYKKIICFVLPLLVLIGIILTIYYTCIKIKDKVNKDAEEVKTKFIEMGTVFKPDNEHHIGQKQKVFIFDMDFTLYYDEKFKHKEIEFFNSKHIELKGCDIKDIKSKETKYSSWGEFFIKECDIELNNFYNNVDCNDLIEKHLKADQNIIDALKKISHKKVIFSNRGQRRNEKLLKLLRLQGIFNMCFVAAKNYKFLLKPQKEAFEYVQKILGV